jgi:hypothetical protein
MPSVRRRVIALGTAASFACVVAAPEFAAAVDTPSVTPPAARPIAVKRTGVKKASVKRASVKKAGIKKTGVKKKKKRVVKRQQTAEQFIQGYRAAHMLIYQKDDYAGGIAALKALGQDQHADVANLIGYASRKLGRYDDAKVWYEKALASDPQHARTWSYYGMWHAEQGNRLKAEDFLQKVASICGNTTCREYTELKGVIDGTAIY